MTFAGLIGFHARHKLIIMSHDQLYYQKLGRMVAAMTKRDVKEQAPSYLSEFMNALKIRATRKNHVNVLQHLSGYLKTNLDKDDKRELIQVIENYRTGMMPLIVPTTLLNHFFRKFRDEYIENSWYVRPYPEQLSLQNMIQAGLLSARNRGNLAVCIRCRAHCA
tara:strand:+ start:127 stop:618 length:492 start_codon:yes stop_codon:yes gene_type:complete